MFKKNTNSIIDLPDINARPIRGEDGSVLADSQFIDVALNTVDSYEKANQSPTPIAPNFIQFLREMKQAITSGVTATQYKNNHIVKTNGGDYSIFFQKRGE
jgi:hypothetical protein